MNFRLFLHNIDKTGDFFVKLPYIPKPRHLYCCFVAWDCAFLLQNFRPFTVVIDPGISSSAHSQSGKTDMQTVKGLIEVARELSLTDFMLIDSGKILFHLTAVFGGLNNVVCRSNNIPGYIGNIKHRPDNMKHGANNILHKVANTLIHVNNIFHRINNVLSRIKNVICHFINVQTDMIFVTRCINNVLVYINNVLSNIKHVIVYKKNVLVSIGFVHIHIDNVLLGINNVYIGPGNIQFYNYLHLIHMKF